MKKISLLITMFLMLGVFSGCSNTNEEPQSPEDNSEVEEKVTFNLSTPDPDSSSITVAAIEFAKRVEEKSDGTIVINVSPNGSMYGADPNAAVKQLGAGSLDMLLLSTSLYANFEPKFNAISVPYVFDDTKQFTDYLNSDIGDELLNELDSMDIKGIGYWTRSFRQITNSVRPIYEPSDLNGVKLRVPNNPLWVDFFKEAGAVPTPMAFGEVYNALQLKTIDGQENPADVPLSAKFYEVQDYVSLTNHMADGWIMGINSDKFNELSDNQKKILEETTKELQAWKVEYDNEQDQNALDSLVENGMELNEITPEQQKLFVEVSQKLYGGFEELVGDSEFFNKTLEFVGKK